MHELETTTLSRALAEQRDEFIRCRYHGIVPRGNLLIYESLALKSSAPLKIRCHGTVDECPWDPEGLCCH